MNKKILNASEMGKKGGSTTKETRGKEFYKEIGSRGNEAMKRLGKEFYKARAKKIAEARRRNRRTEAEKLVDILKGG